MSVLRLKFMKTTMAALMMTAPTPAAPTVIPSLQRYFNRRPLSSSIFHAQAVSVQNIRSLVPLLLDVNSTFYGRWKQSFLDVLGKY